MSESEALKERDRMTNKVFEDVPENKTALQMELDMIDTTYAETPSQKLLDQRLDLLVRMMRRR